MLAQIIALMLPVGIDAFGVSAGLAVGGLAPGRRLRTWLVLAGAEALAPLVGLLAGRRLAPIGPLVEIIAAGVLLIFAIRLLRGEDEGIRTLTDPGPLVLGALALTVGADELAIGIELGVLRAPLVPVASVIVGQALLVSLLGLALGSRVGARAREGAERLAGGILGVVAIVLLVSALWHR